MFLVYNLQGVIKKNKVMVNATIYAISSILKSMYMYQEFILHKKLSTFYIQINTMVKKEPSHTAAGNANWKICNLISNFMIFISFQASELPEYKLKLHRPNDKSDSGKHY